MTDIEARAKRLGLSIGAIAEKAGMARSTPHRWTKGKPWNSGSMDRFLRALEAAENEVVAAIASSRGGADQGGMTS